MTCTITPQTNFPVIQFFCDSSTVHQCSTVPINAALEMVGAELVLTTPQLPELTLLLPQGEKEMLPYTTNSIINYLSSEWNGIT